MPTVLLLTLMTLLLGGTIGGVSLQKTHKVLLAAWINDSCEGHPHFGRQMTLKEGKCYFLQGGGSYRVMQHKKPKHNAWINELNCNVSAYSLPGCLEESPEQQILEVPLQFSECNRLDDHVASVRFQCFHTRPGRRPNFSFHTNPDRQPEDFTTAELYQTSSLVGADGSAHPSTFDTTVTAPSQYPELPTAIAHAEHTATPLENDTRIDSRGMPDEISFWGRHPFTYTEICYTCWTRKHLRYDKFECASGATYPAKCGPKPLPVPLTTYETHHATKSTTTTTIIDYDFSETDVPTPATITVGESPSPITLVDISPSPITLVDISPSPITLVDITPSPITVALGSSTPTPTPISIGSLAMKVPITPTRTIHQAAAATDANLEERGLLAPRTAIIMQHPFLPEEGLLCGKAKWANSGKPNQQAIKLGHWKKLSKCNKKGPVLINIDVPTSTALTVLWATETSTTTIS